VKQADIEKWIELGVLRERQRIADILDGWHVLLCKCDVCEAVREISNTIRGSKNEI
jgi:hypothetical protein